jgi:hypothetical protein
MIHGTCRDKLVWCIQRGFIGYTGLVVINWFDVYGEFIGYRGLVVINSSDVYREDSLETRH